MIANVITVRSMIQVAVNVALPGTLAQVMSLASRKCGDAAWIRAMHERWLATDTSGQSGWIGQRHLAAPTLNAPFGP